MNVPPSINTDASPTGAELQALSAVQCAESAQRAMHEYPSSGNLRTQDSAPISTRAGCRTYNGVLASLKENEATSAVGGLVEESETVTTLSPLDDDNVQL